MKGAEILIPHLSFLATRKSRKAAKKIGGGAAKPKKKKNLSQFFGVGRPSSRHRAEQGYFLLF